jgi:hypothetical protein
LGSSHLLRSAMAGRFASVRQHGVRMIQSVAPHS